MRFELAVKAFAPEMPIIAPWREWDIKSRDEEIDYAIAKNIPLAISRETNYSKDKTSGTFPMRGWIWKTRQRTEIR